MAVKKITILSGVAIHNPGGSGRLLRNIMKGDKTGYCDIKMHSLLTKTNIKRSYNSGIWDSFRSKRYFRKVKNLIVFHPQSIGYKNVIDIIKDREFTWLYVLDNSFFCKRSYNHLDGEDRPCLDCLTGSFTKAIDNRCEYFPVAQTTDNGELEVLLLELSQKGKIGFFAQSKSQQTLLRTHFGNNARIELVGMEADFDSQSDDFIKPENLPCDLNLKKTVVFHGFQVDAKGFEWTLRLMEEMKDKDWLFIFPVPDAFILRKKEYRGNYLALPMSWENGLNWLVANCGLTLVPSLWSAPIEGALIKTLQYAKCTGVVKNESAFSSELPDTILFKLDSEPEVAAKQLENMPNIDRGDVEAWLAQFNQINSLYLEKVVRHVCP